MGFHFPVLGVTESERTFKNRTGYIVPVGGKTFVVRLLGVLKKRPRNGEDPFLLSEECRPSVVPRLVDKRRGPE